MESVRKQRVTLVGLFIFGLFTNCAGLRKIVPVNGTEQGPTEAFPTLVKITLPPQLKPLELVPIPKPLELEPIPIGGDREGPDESQGIPFDLIAAEFPSKGDIYTPVGTKEKIRMCPRHVCGGFCRNPPSDGFAQCYCDSFCEIFNDCCYNYESCAPYKKLAKQLAPVLRSKQHYFECSSKVKMVLVSKCPEGSDDYFAHACHYSGDTTIYRAVPVTVAGIPYKNVYCAQCFGKTLSKTEFWRSDDIDFHIDIQNEITVFLTAVKKPDFGSFFPPPGEQFLRSCYPFMKYKSISHQYYGANDVISTCAESMKYSIKDFELLRWKCTLYNAEVFTLQKPGEFPLRYKNVFCLLCNGISDQKVACPVIFSAIAAERRPDLNFGYNPEEFDLSAGEETRRVGPDFTDLFHLQPDSDLAEMTCEEGLVYDDLKQECRMPRRCDVAQTEWRGECIRNPFDQAYVNPVNGGYDVFTVEMKYTFTAPLVLIVSEKDELGTDWRKLVLKAVARTLEVPTKEIIDLKATLRPINVTTKDLLGGKEITYGKGTEVVTSFFCAKKQIKHIDDLALNINYTAQEAIWTNVTFNITNANVTRPLECAKGDLVTIDESVMLVEFLTSWSFPKNTDSLKRLETINENNHLYFSVCDVYAEKFKGCKILNFTLDDFEGNGTSTNLVFTESGDEITEDVYTVIGDIVFVCYREVRVYAHTDSVSVILTIIGLSLSIIFLIYILITYALFKILRTLPGTMLMHLCAILLIAQLLFVTSTLPGSMETFCFAFSIIHHYAWLSTFFWMNAIAINLVRTFTMAMKAVSRPNPRKTLMKFAAYAYGVPGIIVLICVVLELTSSVAIGYGTGGRTGSSCWLSQRDGLLYAFFIPVAAIVTVNIGLFIATAVSIIRTKKITQKATEQGASKIDFLLYAKISTLIGFTWILGFIGALTNAPAIWYCFIIFNTLSGVFLALGFAFNKRIFKLWRSTVTDVSVTTSGTKSTSFSRSTRLMSSDSTSEKGAYMAAKTTDSEF